jgi:sugar phosphate isomerase/epimerase
MVYVSTGGEREKTACEVSIELLDAGIKCVELSGGAFSETLLSDLSELKEDINFQIHNYFPPAKIPFVLNLGTLDSEIGNRCISHVEQAIQWCSELGCTRYGVHAGFLLDPKVDELGKRIPNRNLFDRDESIEIFVKRIKYLAGVAEKAGITLMIENNVLSAKNAFEFSANPLLMCDPNECQEIMSLLPNNVGLLIDVAHLKVSAKSLNFNPSRMFDLCHKKIIGYHLSDNNGLEDSNMPFTEDAWFWSLLNPDVKYFTVEVYNRSPIQLLEQANIVRSKLKLSD